MSLLIHGWRLLHATGFTVPAFILFLAITVGMALLLWLTDAAPAPWYARNSVAGLTAAAGLFAGLVLIVGACIYTFSDVLTDHVEPSMIVTSTLWNKGQPIYQDARSANQCSLLYGPCPYVVEAAFLRAFGPSIPVAKLSGFICLVGAMVLLFALLIRETSFLHALAGCGFCFICLCQFQSISYWVRPDALVLLSVGAALYASRDRRRWAAIAITAIALGIAADSKINAMICLLPVYWLLRKRHGNAAVAASLGIGGAVAFLPFLALRGIDLHVYLDFLSLAAKHGLNRAVFLAVMGNLFCMLLPCCLVIGSLRVLVSGRSRAGGFADTVSFAVVLGGAMLLMAVPASKIGSGPYHLLPFAPLVAYLFATALFKAKDSEIGTWALRLTAGACCGSVLLWAFTGSRQQAHLIREFLNDRLLAAQVMAEIRSIERKYPSSSIGMGYGDGIVGWTRSYAYTSYRPQLAFDGQPRLIDIITVMDNQQAGVAIPDATVEAVRNGFIQIWLVPVNEPPFSMRSYYAPHQSVFGKGFRQALLANYKKSESGTFFDIWVYRGSSPLVTK